MVEDAEMETHFSPYESRNLALVATGRRCVMAKVD